MIEETTTPPGPMLKRSEASARSFTIPNIRSAEEATYRESAKPPIKFMVRAEGDGAAVDFRMDREENDWRGAVVFDRETRAVATLNASTSDGRFSYEYSGDAIGLISMLADSRVEETSFSIRLDEFPLSPLLAIPFSGITVNEETTNVTIKEETFGLRLLDLTNKTAVVVGTYTHAHLADDRYFRLEFERHTSFPSRVQTQLVAADQVRSYHTARSELKPGTAEIGFGQGTSGIEQCHEPSPWERIPVFSDALFGFSSERALQVMESSSGFQKFLEENDSAALSSSFLTNDVGAGVSHKSHGWFRWYNQSDRIEQVDSYTIRMSYDKVTDDLKIVAEGRGRGDGRFYFLPPDQVVSLDHLAGQIARETDGHLDVAITSQGAASHFGGMRIALRESPDAMAHEPDQIATEWAFHPTQGCRVLKVTY